jgi:hypothetical protein
MPPFNSHYLLRFLPDGDGAAGGTGTEGQQGTQPATPTPGTTPGQQSGQQGGGQQQGENSITMNTHQLNQRIEQGVRVFTDGLLKKLGLDKIEDLEAVVTDHKKRADGEKTASQLAEEAKAKAEKRAVEAEAEVKRLEAGRIADKVGAALAKIASDGKLKAQYPSDIAEHIQTKMSEQFSALWKDGKVDEKEAEKLVEAVKKERPGWFVSGGPGSPSNTRGLTPEPGEQAKKELANRKLFRL